MDELAILAHHQLGFAAPHLFVFSCAAKLLGVVILSQQSHAASRLSDSYEARASISVIFLDFVAPPSPD
jgi:hypothetical protein